MHVIIFLCRPKGKGMDEVMNSKGTAAVKESSQGYASGPAITH